MKETVFTLEEILAILPHREPFLFVDRVTAFSPDRTITTERLIRADEYWCRGHFPAQPIMPGVLITDGLAQTAGLLWGFSKQAREGKGESGAQLFYLAACSMKYTAPARPGDRLELQARVQRAFAGLHSYQVEACCGRTRVAGGTLTLSMTERDA